MKCGKCGSNNNVKAGKLYGRQRYQCKNCKYKYTTQKFKGYPGQLKKEAIKYYLEGVGFRQIERLLNVSNVTVMRWVRKLGESVKEMHISNIGKRRVKMMEIDEMCTFIGKKNNIYGYGMLLIEQKDDITPLQLVIVPPKR